MGVLICDCTLIIKDSSSEACCQAIRGNFRSFLRTYGSYPDRVFWDRDDMVLLSHGLPHHYGNGVYFTQFNEDEANKKIENAIEFFSERNVPFLWFVDPETKPEDMPSRLTKHGLQNVGEYKAMASNLNTIKNQLGEPTGFEIKQVKNKSDMKTFWNIWYRGYEYPEFLYDNFYETSIKKKIRHPDRQLYIGYLEGKPVATSHLLMGGGAAGLWWVTVLPEARGKGIGTFISQWTIMKGKDNGYKLSTLYSTEMGHPIYKKIGFQDYFSAQIYLWMPKI